jgi:hypothetical protein
MRMVTLKAIEAPGWKSGKVYMGNQSPLLVQDWMGPLSNPSQGQNLKCMPKYSQ